MHLVTNFAPPCCNRGRLAELQRVFFLLLQGQHALPRPFSAAESASSHRISNLCTLFLIESQEEQRTFFSLFSRKSPVGLSLPADLPHPDAVPHSGSLPLGALKHFFLFVCFLKSLLLIFHGFFLFIVLRVVLFLSHNATPHFNMLIISTS